MIARSILGRLSARELRAFKALTWAFACIGFRAQHYASATGVKAGELVPPFFWVVGQHLTTSLLLCLTLFARTDAWFFAFANLSAAIVLTFSTLIVELDEIVFNREDAKVIGHRPVSLRVYALARGANLVGYVGLIFLALTIMPAIVGLGLADTNWTFLPAYLLASATSITATASLVVIAHGLLHRFDLRRVQTGLAWVQILAILALF